MQRLLIAMTVILLAFGTVSQIGTSFLYEKIVLNAIVDQA
jgi:hypothetical protein